MNAPPEQVTLTPTECGDCGGPLAQAFPTTRNYLRCRRCGHVIPATANQATDWAHLGRTITHHYG